MLSEQPFSQSFLRLCRLTYCPHSHAPLHTHAPQWMAPNMVTLLGSMCVISSYLITLYHCNQLIGALPSWVNVYIALALFAYQTLDAIDGKQARRTKQSSPLGQLFDHGRCSVTRGPRLRAYKELLLLLWDNAEGRGVARCQWHDCIDYPFRSMPLTYPVLPICNHLRYTP